MNQLQPVLPQGALNSIGLEAIDQDVRTLQEATLPGKWSQELLDSLSKFPALRVVLGGYGRSPSTDPKEHRLATEWLNTFRSKDDGWDACIAVLGAQRGIGQGKVTLEEQVFTSQALLYKCRRRLTPITGEDVGHLLRLALAFTGRGLRPVLTQLCLGICACAVRNTGWEAAKVLPDMVFYCQQVSGDTGHGDFGPRVLMLELLTVLPEEASARTGISVHPDRRAEFLWTLRVGRGEGGGGLALGVLSQLLEPGALPVEGARAAILRCALAWVQLGAVEWIDLFASPIMALALDSLEVLEACDEACEFLTVTVEAFTDPGAVQEMLPRILAKGQALATAQSEDVRRCLATVFSSAACAYLPCILQPELSGPWMALLQVMVALLECSSLEIAALALELWGGLGNLLSDASRGPQGQRSFPLEEFVKHACRVAMLRARQPTPEEGGLAGLDPDARDELEDFRQQVLELVQTLTVPCASSESGAKDDGESASSSRPLPNAALYSRSSSSPSLATSSGLGDDDAAADRTALASPMSSLRSEVGVTSTQVASGTPKTGNTNAGSEMLTWSGSSTVVLATDGRKGTQRGPFHGGVAGGGKSFSENRSRSSTPPKRGIGGGGRHERPGASPVVAPPRCAAGAQAQAQAQAELSPVQLALLEWLEGLAAESTIESLRLSTDASTGHVRAADARAGLNGGGNSATGEETESGLSKGAGAMRTPDWARVEVFLRMLSAASKALILRDGLGFSREGSQPGTWEGGGSPVVRVGPSAFEVGQRAPLGGEDRTGPRGALEALMDVLPALPPGLRELRKSAVVLVGSLAVWLARRPWSMQPALKSVLDCLALAEDGVEQAGVETGPSMRDGGEEHVAAVALYKLSGAAGPSLAAMPKLPTHLLDRYLGFSLQLQRHRLHVASPSAWAPQAGGVSRGVHQPGTGGAVSSPAPPPPSGPLFPEYLPVSPPPLHASSLRLFLGCLCRMLGEDGSSTAAAPSFAAESGVRGGFRGSVAVGGMSCAPWFGEMEEVLGRLVKAEMRWLGDVLDRRRQLDAVPGRPASPADEQRALDEFARDSLSNLALILRRAAPSLDAPGHLARDGGVGGVWGEGALGAGGFLVKLAGVDDRREDKIIAGVCDVFEALVRALAERLRFGENRGLDAELRPGRGGGSTAGTVGVNGHVHGRGGVGGGQNAEGSRLALALGDALAEAFMRRPFVRFLEALRAVTKELVTFDRHASEAGSDAVPSLSLRACHWVDRCLWFAATGAAGVVATPGAPGVLNNANGVFVSGGWGHGAAANSDPPQPELVEALFQLMKEWVVELPVPSLRWLQAWLSVAICCLTVRHRGPARAVLGLIRACCEQSKVPSFTVAFGALMRDTSTGLFITRGLLSALCGAMPSWMMDDLVATVRSLFDALLPTAVSGWIEAVLNDPSFERYPVSDEAKVTFVRKLKEDYCCKDWRGFKAGLKAFCGGKKKGTAGTPPAHASHRRNPSDQGAHRPQQQPQQPQQQQQQAQQGHHRRAPGVRHSIQFSGVPTGEVPGVSPSMLRMMTT